MLLGAQALAPDRERRLGGRIGADTRPPDAPRGASDVDDRARRRRAQQRQQRLDQAAPLRVEVERHRPAHQPRAGRGEVATAPGAGVVDEQVEPAAVMLDQVRAGACRRLLAEQIEREHGRRAGSSPRAAPSRSARRAKQHELHAGLAREPPRGRLAEPARLVGDQGHGHRARSYVNVNCGNGEGSECRDETHRRERRSSFPGTAPTPVRRGRDVGARRSSVSTGPAPTAGCPAPPAPPREPPPQPTLPRLPQSTFVHPGSPCQ